MGASKEPFKRRVGDYYIGRTIGEGSYAKVKYGEHVTTGRPVAIKVIEKKRIVEDKLDKQIKREIAILKSLKHPNIVDLIDVMASKERVYVVMELVPGGELFDYITANGYLDEATGRRLFQQLIDAVAYCHGLGVYHRDLKPENVLLGKGLQVKISDFGLSTLPSTVSPEAVLQTACGTPHYVSPEVILRKGYAGPPADVWSLGVILYVMLSGSLPFDDASLAGLFQKISKAEYQVPPWFTPSLKSLLRRMLLPDPKHRATISEIRSDPWFLTDYKPVEVESLASEPTDEERDTLFRETVMEEAVTNDASSSSSQPPRPLNAFELLSQSINLSSLFDTRPDTVVRHTRFTSQRPMAEIIDRVETAIAAMKGRCERKAPHRIKCYLHHAVRGPVSLSVEVSEVIPGVHMVEVSRGQGEHLAFHAMYVELRSRLEDIVYRSASRKNVEGRERGVSEMLMNEGGGGGGGGGMGRFVSWGASLSKRLTRVSGGARAPSDISPLSTRELESEIVEKLSLVDPAVRGSSPPMAPTPKSPMMGIFRGGSKGDDGT